MADSVEQMVFEYASEAVDQARAQKVALDFSEASVEKLEQLVGAASPQNLDEASKMWGAYLGEVVRRRWGGEWSIESYPGGQFATLTLTVHGSKLFPSLKIYRRLTGGTNENLATFYQAVKERLGKAPRAEVN